MYQCIATIKTNYFDTRNDEYWTSRLLILTENSLDKLYQAIARAKIAHNFDRSDYIDNEDDEDSDNSLIDFNDRSKISFSPIHVITSSSQIDENKLASTEEWKAYCKKLEQEKTRKQEYKQSLIEENLKKQELLKQQQSDQDMQTYFRIKKSLEDTDKNSLTS